MEDKVLKYLSSHNISKEVFADTVSAVILNEILKGDNKQETNLESFILEFPNLGLSINPTLDKNTIKPLPRVQIKRIVIDSIIISGNSLEDMHLTMPSSSGITRGVTGVKTYSDEAECDKLLETIFMTTDDYSDCEGLFKFIESSFKQVSESCHYNDFKAYNFSEVFLPSEYNSYGMSVSRNIPSSLKDFTQVERLKYFENNFAVQFASAFLNTVYNTNSRGIENVRRLRALSVLDDFIYKYSDIIPINIDTNSSKLKICWMPKHKTPSDFNLFSRVFARDGKATLNDVTKMLSVLNKI